MTNAIRHILVVDDNPSIHEDFRKIFAPLTAAERSFAEASARLFDAEPEGANISYELEFASQGSEALERVARAIATQRPYSMAFIDIQMSPGLNGIETMGRIREIAPELQFVICTAHSDYGLNDIVRKAGRANEFAVIKKPFEAIEVLQLANVLSEKARLLNEARERARKLEESQHRYRFLAEAMPGMVWTATANGNADYFNQQWCDYTGMNFEQSKDWGWQSAIHPEDLPHSLEEWTRALRTGENFECEFRVRRASDGAYRWQLHRAVPMRNQQGQILHWVCASTDIHDKKGTENELREAKENLERHVAERTLELTQSEARYRELVNGQAEGVVYTDAELKFIFANPAAESLFGLWPGQLLGRRLEEFLDERNRAVLQQQIKRRRAGEKSRYEIAIIGANGERRQVLITGAPKMDSTGRLCGTFAIFSDITQLKNVEIALRENQRLLSAVLNNIPDPAWLKDSQGRYLVGNKPLAEVYRRNLEDIIGKTVFEVFPSAAASLMEGDRQIADSGKPTRTEVCLPDGEGNSRWFDTIETPIFDESGKLASTVGIARDVSDYKRVESALRESEARYLDLLNSQDDGIVIVDDNQVFTFANPALGRILEVPVRDLLGRNFREFLDDEQRAIMERQVARRKAGEKTSYEVEVTTGSGQRRQIFVTSTPRMDGNGRLVGTFAVARDITERKRTEEKLHLQTSALAATVNGIVITDASGKILWINPAFSRLTGYSEAEVIGKTSAVLKSGVHTNEFYKELWKTIREGKVWRGEMVNRRKDGSTYCEEASITPVLDERGAIRNFVAVKQDVSRRKHDEAQLRDREEAFRALADNVPDAVVRVNRDMRLVYGNRAFAKDVGKEPETFLGKTGEELNLPGAEKWRRELVEVFRTGEPRGFEFDWASGDGTFYRESRLVPERSSTGEVEFILAVTRDITERRQAEEALREKSALLEALINSSADGILVVNEQGRRIVQNKQFNRLLKIPAQIAAHSEDSEQLRYVADSTRNPEEFCQKVLRLNAHPEESSRDEIEFQDGRVLDRNTAGVFGKNGEYFGRLWSFLDITERKQMTEVVRRSEAKFRVLFETARDAKFILDPQGNVLDVNLEACRQLQYSREELLRMNVREIDTPEQAALAPERIRQLIHDGHSLFETVSRRRDGTVVPFEINSQLLQYDGQPRILATCRDLTERKLSERERQLLDLQLRQAQKMEAIGQLAAGIAHEINTPTQYVGDNTRFLKDAFENITKALRGYTELIAAARANAITPETLARAEEILSSSDLQYQFDQIPAAIKETLEGVDRVSKIVRAMKEFSHPGGREKSTADLNKAIDSTVTVARNEWKYVADIVLDLQPDLPLVPCFIGEFNQAILNLVINAAHAIADVVRGEAGQKGIITIRTRREGDCVEVRVSDTGTGIPEEHRHRIFEPFFTTKDVGKGTGQGLTVVYSSIVKKHGGTVTFETETGKGTTFILRLPLVSRGTSPAIAEPSKEAVRLSAPPSLTAA